MTRSSDINVLSTGYKKPLRSRFQVPLDDEPALQGLGELLPIEHEYVDLFVSTYLSSRAVLLRWVIVRGACIYHEKLNS